MEFSLLLLSFKFFHYPLWNLTCKNKFKLFFIKLLSQGMRVNIEKCLT